jgi:hypothetical protein
MTTMVSIILPTNSPADIEVCAIDLDNAGNHVGNPYHLRTVERGSYCVEYVHCYRDLVIREKREGESDV